GYARAEECLCNSCTAAERNSRSKPAPDLRPLQANLERPEKGGVGATRICQPGKTYKQTLNGRRKAAAAQRGRKRATMATPKQTGTACAIPGLIASLPW